MCCEQAGDTYPPALICLLIFPFHRFILIHHQIFLHTRAGASLMIINQMAIGDVHR